MALDMLPSFRWRWERKDPKPGHPLIAKLAEKVLDVNLHQVAPTGPPMLIPEQDWDGENILSPKPGSMAQPGAPTTPKVGPAHGLHAPGAGPYGVPPMGTIKGSPVGGNFGGPGGGHNGDTKGAPAMPDLPQYYFYPMYSENGAAANGPMAPNMAFPHQSDHYVLEEKELPAGTHVQAHWDNVSVVVRPRSLEDADRPTRQAPPAQRPPPPQPQFGPPPQT